MNTGHYVGPGAVQSTMMRRYNGENGMPKYDDKPNGHFGACQAISKAGHAPRHDIFQGAYANVVQGVEGEHRDIMCTYWQHQVTELEDADHDYKGQQLPLARIKKVMKADPDVKMISAEAPILFAKGCDLFITELAMRAWVHAEENKRRTLQRSDIANALGKSDMFDFLIDIVPREDATPSNKRKADSTPAAAYSVPEASMDPSMMPPAAMGGHDFTGMPQHISSDGSFPAQMVYQQQGQGTYPTQVPFDASTMYQHTAYGMPQQPMYGHQGQQMDPSVTAAATHHYHPQSEANGEDDGEGDRDY